MDKIYTIGYGRIKGPDKWPQFFKRLVDADISCVVDIRRKGSKSRNGKAFYWGCHPVSMDHIGDLLFEKGIEYITIPDLANRYGSLGKFGDAMRSALIRRQGLLAAGYHELIGVFYEYGSGNICLMCCERDWRKCHRKIVAQYIADEMELEVVHL